MKINKFKEDIVLIIYFIIIKPFNYYNFIIIRTSYFMQLYIILFNNQNV